MFGETVIGLMDSAYFVSKNELLKWINETLNLEIVYIQDLGSGSIYCQLIDAYHRHVVPMSKVNWKAKFQYQFMSNLKIFQTALQKIGGGRKFDVNKLVKAKYQDNLETIQWLKRYLQKTATKIQNYDPVARRNGEVFFSHHAQKNSFINRPTKLSQCSSQSALTCTFKKDALFNQQNTRADKLEQIKRILSLKQNSDVKVYLISEIVFGGKGEKSEKGLSEIEINHNSTVEETL